MATEYTDVRVSLSASLPTGQEQHHALNRLWGYPDGTVPLDITGPSPHRDAAYRVSAIMQHTLCYTIRIYKTGVRQLLSVEVVPGSP